MRMRTLSVLAASAVLIAAAFNVPATAEQKVLRYVPQANLGAMDPASGDTFQVDTAMEAFGNGGWFGLGPGEGIAKRSLPDSHTDFVFAVGAECGVGSAILTIEFAV